ncbi:hypothetical protein KDA_74450 [Dictyobacter alpinus]|uniref:Uncharacterized protein n=1 Tax=Dictyobacter alpinus TaxID=2014873 RepID=A0A402BKV0_9CHLR|nr:hypothetical protein KDA_74450 [Dictyobacter alpinus]
MCDRETGVLAVEMEGVAEKARGTGGEVIPGCEDGGVIGHYEYPFGVAARSGEEKSFHVSYTAATQTCRTKRGEFGELEGNSCEDEEEQG